jgi:hypothetical protein
MATLISFEPAPQQSRLRLVLMLLALPVLVPEELVPEELVLAVAVVPVAVEAAQQFDRVLLTVAVTVVAEYLFASCLGLLCLVDQSALYFSVKRQLTRMTIPKSSHWDRANPCS